jgi:hypothetical protein
MTFLTNWLIYINIVTNFVMSRLNYKIFVYVYMCLILLHRSVHFYIWGILKNCKLFLKFIHWSFSLQDSTNLTANNTKLQQKHLDNIQYKNYDEINGPCITTTILIEYKIQSLYFHFYHLCNCFGEVCILKLFIFIGWISD